MDEDGRVGAVAALEDVVHAISVARGVMEKTPHTMLVGEGATRFALDQGMVRTRLLTPAAERSEEPTSELQSLMRISYADFCLKTKRTTLSQRSHRPSDRH